MSLIKKSLVLLTAIVSSVCLVACGGKGVDEVVELKFKDTVSLSELKKYDGKTIKMTGFMSTSTPLDGKYMYLMNMPYQNCAFCVPNSDSLVNTLAVYAKDGDTFEFTDVPVEIEGKLKFEKMTDSMGYTYEYRVVDATLKKADVSELADDIKIYTDLIDLGFVNAVEDIFTEMYSILNYEEFDITPTKLEDDKIKQIRDMFDTLDKSKYEDIISIIDEVESVIDKVNEDIEVKDYTKFTDYNTQMQDAYTSYSQWLLKPEI